MTIDRSKMKQDLLSRTKEAPTMDSRVFGRSFFKDGIEEQGVVFWKCGASDHLLDIIPYVAGQNDPNERVKEGDWACVLIVFIHNNVGAAKDRYVCPAVNFRRPCPICEEQQEAAAAGDEARAKALRPQEMCVYNIVCYDNDKELQKGVQVWAVAHWNFQRYLNKLANRSQTGEPVAYADPDTGRTIFFNREGTKKENTKYIGHALEPRDYIIGDDVLNQAWCLDDLIYVPKYEEMYIAHKGCEPPAPGSKERSTGPESSPSPTGRSLAGRRTLASEHAPAPTPAANPPQPVSRPASASGTAPASAPTTSGTTSKPSSNVSGEPICPASSAGGQFGVSVDNLDNCTTCDIYDDCARKAKQIDDERKAKLTTGATRGGRRTLS